MKIKVTGTQIFGDHEEKVEQEFEDARIEFKEVCEIEYKSGKIIFDKRNMVVEIQNGNDIIIENGKERITNYITSYGDIKLKTYGEEMLLEENPFKIIIKYEITLNETETYKNMLEIVTI